MSGFTLKAFGWPNRVLTPDFPAISETRAGEFRKLPHFPNLHREPREPESRPLTAAGAYRF
jgi:hypothetical protein